jgi:hypothetical protein
MPGTFLVCEHAVFNRHIVTVNIMGTTRHTTVLQFYKIMREFIMDKVVVQHEYCSVLYFVTV